MSTTGTVDAVLGFRRRLENKVRDQIAGRRVGYLLGAGASFIEGQGYPLASQLWNIVGPQIAVAQRADIQRVFDAGVEDLESALDALDMGQVDGTPHRQSVTDAIALHFGTLEPPIEDHVRFLTRLSGKPEAAVYLFNLNYDPLVELASDFARIRAIDGFQGVENPYFDSNSLQFSVGIVQRGFRGSMFRTIPGIIHHYKLHGSLGWYECPKTGIRRCSIKAAIPKGTKRLMVPPQHRKVTETLAFPYETLWSEFRRVLRHGPFLLNRLVTIGYGMRDSHVNAVIDNALSRPDFTLLVFAKELRDEVFQRWSLCPRAILVTESRSSLYSEVGPGHPTLWNFRYLSKEI